MNSIKHHELKAEWVDDVNGPAVMLTQADDGFCEPQTVLVHPWQLRATCEHFGILPGSDDQVRHLLATLTRRLLVLSERVSELRHYVATCSDHEHADLHAEMVMLNALGDLATEWAQEAQDLQLTGGRTRASPDGSEGRSAAQHAASGSLVAGASVGVLEAQSVLL